MDKDEIKDLIERFRLLQEEIANAYLDNVMTFTEIGAPKEVFEMLERENIYLLRQSTQRIKMLEFQLATM